MSTRAGHPVQLPRHNFTQLPTLGVLQAGSLATCIDWPDNPNALVQWSGTEWREIVGMRKQLDSYTTAGTYTITVPAWAKTATVVLYGGGQGGGGAPASTVTSDVLNSGAGGSSGYVTDALLVASELAGMEVVVGVGGLGGNGGAAGTGLRPATVGLAGGNSLIRGAGGGATLLRAHGANGGVGLLGKIAGVVGGSSSTSTGNSGSNSGTVATGTSTPTLVVAGSGGGSGGGMQTNGTAALNGGTSGQRINGFASPNTTGRSAGGVGNGGNGGAGANSPMWQCGGEGGGGGAGGTTNKGGNGGTGGSPGGGGGGGGSHRGALAGGSGGNGGTGAVYIIWEG